MNQSLREASPTARRPCSVCGERIRLTGLFRRRGYHIVRCGVCDLAYVQELPSAEALRGIYSASFFNVGSKFDRSPELSSSRMNAKERVSALLRLPDIGTRRWLDVGCATGDFVREARQKKIAVTGTELSPWAVREAQQRGVDGVLEGDFLELPLPEGMFDVVTMWDLIAHVRDPLGALRKARGLLRPGGYLALTTGDITSRLARLTGRYWHLIIPPKHLYYFSPRSMGAALERADLDCVLIEHPGKRVPLDFMLWKAAYMAAPSTVPIATHLGRILGLRRFKPRINLRDIMTVVARKPS